MTGPEERLLTALAGIEVDRNLRRDFPEELSMPSVARRLGVVRSALHNPISSLESKGLLDSIKSNVIGAPRKKTVLLITKKGLEVASNFGLIEKQTTKLNQILGRDKEIEAICRALESPGIVVLTGLPGIGKSSVAKAVCSKLEQEKKKVGWHTGSRMTSTSSLIESWTDIPVSENFDELGDGFDPNMVYILDEAQEIHRRHADNIRRVLENARHAKILVVTRSPSTFSSLSETLKITLEGLEIEVAARIADHLTEEQATQVAIALDGHPLAIQMWRDGDDVPIPGTPVADFISSTVLDRLDTNTAQELEDLTLEPFPISRGDSITDLSIDNLDDATILKWSGSRFESQHLIKHVKLASLDEDKVKSIHERLVDRWSEIEGFEARGHEMHHRILSGQSVSKGLAEDVFDNLGPVVASTLLSDALDNEERGDLRILSARAA
ncbi:MAG: AAA family ATPase, partial [Candidatus Thermoplasmatota archaeon]|nr:AAA family ATPase [Candidatus Thermoplasmatota archaeon]